MTKYESLGLHYRQTEGFLTTIFFKLMCKLINLLLNLMCELINLLIAQSDTMSIRVPM